MKCSRHGKGGSHGHRDYKTDAREKLTKGEEMEGDEF
jgi:hypothetical protein